MQCPQCEQEISLHLTVCDQCGAQLGYPNVRQAARESEVKALEARYNKSVEETKNRGCETVLEEFEKWIVESTRPVICRKWGTIEPLLSRTGDLFRTFYELIEAKERVPLDNFFDQARQAVDATFFPHYYQRVNFAALAGDGRGPESYGDCHFTFKENAINHRTTVFEENTLVFCVNHSVIAGQPPPAGYLSTWDNRGQVAVCKLAMKLDNSTQMTDFPGILIIQTGITDGDEFIECHIFGRLTVSNIESFWAKAPTRKADKLLAKRIRKKLKALDVDEIT
ncbi:MAG: zinc-ribbon domain-containing protein [Planctomycetota bacterium]